MAVDSVETDDNKEVSEAEPQKRSLASRVWAGKWMVLALTAVGACLAGAVHTLMPTKYQASLTFEPVSELVTAPYKRLQTQFPNAGHTPTPNTLFERFTSELRQFDNVDYAARTSGILSSSDISLTSETFHTENFEWLPHFKNPENPESDLVAYSVSAIGEYPAVLEHFFKLLINRSTEKTRLAVESHYLSALDGLESARHDEISRVRQQMQSIRRSYSDQKSHRLALLKEQAAIARNAGIDKPISGSDAGLYSRGYLALEKEIELLENRTSDEAYIPELVELSRQLAKLEGDTSAKQLSALLKTSPIAKGNFIAGKYDSRTLLINRAGLPLTIMILIGSLLGFMIGALSLLVYIVARR